MPRYRIVNPSSYSSLKNKDKNKAVSISEIMIAIIFIITKNNLRKYVPSKQSNAISDHKTIVTHIFAKNGRKKLDLMIFNTTAPHQNTSSFFPLFSLRSSTPLKYINTMIISKIHEAISIMFFTLDPPVLKL